MSTATQQRLLTAEEFAQLPQPEDGSQQEFVHGVIITMPPPSFYHGLCCNEMSYRLGKHVREQKLGHVTCNDSGVILARNPDVVRGPDLAFWHRERLPEPPRSGYPDIAPDLVVEVLSPSNVFPQILRKVQQVSPGRHAGEVWSGSGSRGSQCDRLPPGPGSGHPWQRRDARRRRCSARLLLPGRGVVPLILPQGTTPGSERIDCIRTPNPLAVST